MSDSVVTLDAREFIQSGRDAFALIMGAVSRLADGESLLLLAPFEPEPLYQVMALRGFDYMATLRDNGDWEILFSPCAKRSGGPEERPARGRAAPKR